MSMFVMPDGEGEDDPAYHYERLLQYDEHEHLRNGEPNVAFLFRVHPLQEQGRAIIGQCIMPNFQGRLSKVGEWMMEELFGSVPDFLFILDKDWWDAATPLQREILVFHEMMHAGQAKNMFGAPKFTREGKPVWAIRGHDVEEFTSVVLRYGAWQPEIASFVAAVNQSAKFNHD